MRHAIVILHYKNLSDTIDLLESLSQCDVPKGHQFSNYVVNNDGNKELEDQIKKFPQTQIIISPANLGFAGGNNLGFDKAIADGNDVIICMNNDTLVKKDFLERITGSPIGDEKIGAIGGLVYFAPGYEFKKNYRKEEIGKVVWYAGGVFDWDNILGSNGHVDEVDSGQFTKTEETDFVTGALLITRADVLQKVGLFDANYFMYLEDVDLCHRIRKAGYKIIIDPRIKMWHKVAQGSGIGSSVNDYFITRNRLYFGLKFARVRTKFALLREALRKLVSGTPAQKKAVVDFFTGKLGKSTYK